MRLLPVAAAALLLAGCLDDTAPAAPPPRLYGDAQAVFADSVADRQSAERSYVVPEGKGLLLIRATYTVNGTAEFDLTDPNGVKRQSEDVDEAKTADNVTWAQIRNPEPGGWTLSVKVAGSARYAFGFYVAGNATATAETLYKDAKFRVAKKVAGAESDTQSINVPVGTSSLKIRATYVVDGAASFELFGATRLSERDDAVSGHGEAQDSVWYEKTNPLPGTYEFDWSVSGDAEFAFGVYY